MSINDRRFYDAYIAAIDDKTKQAMDNMAKLVCESLPESSSHLARIEGQLAESLGLVLRDVKPTFQALNIAAHYAAYVSESIDWKALHSALKSYLRDDSTADSYRTISISEEFYEAAAPLLEIAQSAPDSDCAPEISSAMKDVRSKPKILTVDRALNLIGILLTVLVFVFTQVSSTISDMYEAERDQAQIEATQQTNNLLEQQIEISKDQLEVQKQQLEVLQSLDDSIQYLTQLAESISEGKSESIDVSDALPELPEANQVGDLVDNQAKPN